MPRKLVDITVEKVDAVDRPANGRKFLIVKRNDEGEELDKRTLNDVVDHDEARHKMYSLIEAFYRSIRETMGDDDLSEEEKAQQIQTSAGQLTNKLNDIAPDLAKRLDINRMKKQAKESYTGGEDSMENREELLKSVDDEDLRDNLEKAFDALESKIEELQKSDEDDNDEGEEFAKDELPEPVRKRMESLEKQAKKAEEIAKKERKERKKVEFKKRAKKYDSVADVEKLQKTLLELDDTDTELREDVEEILKSAQERVESGDLFKEAGDSGEDVSDAEATLEKKAQEIQDSEGVTFEKAYSIALERNPDLYRNRE